MSLKNSEERASSKYSGTISTIFLIRMKMSNALGCLLQTTMMQLKLSIQDMDVRNSIGTTW